MIGTDGGWPASKLVVRDELTRMGVFSVCFGVGKAVFQLNQELSIAQVQRWIRANLLAVTGRPRSRRHAQLLVVVESLMLSRNGTCEFSANESWFSLVRELAA